VSFPGRHHRGSHPRSAVSFDPNGVPAQLIATSRWVLWQYALRGGLWTKLPLTAKTGRLASVGAPETWMSFRGAVEALKGSTPADGVGIVFDGTDGLMGVDLDGCVDAAGQLSDEASRIVNSFNSYAEYSPSGTGVKIFVYAAKPASARCTSTMLAGIKKVEVYQSGRYFTVTGQSVHGAARQVVSSQPALDALCNELWPQPLTTPRRVTVQIASDADDDNVLLRICRSRQGERFRKLWAGDTGDYGDDHSRADLALCNILAFWFNGDPDRIDRVFRRSGLFRPKWDEARGRGTYGQLTIAVATGIERRVAS
jgi:primase-polymerase (primpol)-like protein